MKLNKVLSVIVPVGLLLLVLTPLFVSDSLLFPFISGKAFFFRIIIEIIFVAWLILALRVPAYRPRSSWIFTVLAAFIAVLVLATVWGVNPFRSFWSNYERMEGLVSYLHLFAYFLILISVMQTKRLWVWFLHGSLAVNLIINIYALLQWAETGSTRVDATLGNPSYLAVYVLFHIFLLGFLFSRLLVRNDWRQNIVQRFFGAGYLILLLLNLFILYHTQTRGAILGLIGGVFVGALWLAIFSPRVSREKRWGVGVIIAVLALTALFFTARQSDFMKNSPTLSRLAAISLEEKTTRSRFMIWEMSWQGFKERPIFGWGPDNYIVVFNKYYNPRLYDQEQWFDRAHNVFFDWLISAGALGLLSYLLLFVAVIYYLFKHRHDGPLKVVEQAIIVGLLAAYFFHNFFVFDQLISLLLFFGLLAYLHTRFAKPWSPPVEQKLLMPVPRAGALVVSVIVVIGLIAGLYFINLKPLLASRTIIQALSNAKNYPEIAFEDFKRVFAYDTFASTEATEQLFPLALQLLRREDVSTEVRQNYLTLATDRLEAAIKRETRNARYPFFIGSLYLRTGQIDQAIERLEQTRALSPRKQAILFELASAYLEKGRREEALATLHAAYESAPAYEEARKFYALALIYNNQLAEADKILTEGFGTVLIDDDRFLNAYVENKLYERVLKLWQEKVEREPDNAGLRGSLGLAYLYNNQRTQAIAEFRKAAELDPAYTQEVERVIKEIQAGRNPYP